MHEVFVYFPRSQFQIRDSAAIVEFLVWLEEQIAAGEEISEASCAGAC